MAKGALTSKIAGEGDIRKALIDACLIDCVVNLPGKLFLNTQIPASLWFLRRGKTYRREEILFIDARNLGRLINRRTLELTDQNIEKIAKTYHCWRANDDGYQDSKGFCKSVNVAEVAKLDYVLTPGRYVGLEEKEDDFDFAERFNHLKAELASQMQEETILNKRILENLEKVKIDK